MATQKITAEVEVNFEDGKRTIQMELKHPSEVVDCQEGKVVMFILMNDETYTGIFKGMDGDDDIIIDSLSGKSTVGLKIIWVSEYFEEIKK